MPDNDVWPPKPNLPDPLTEYDDVIAAKLAALPGGDTERKRFRLIVALREEGLDVRRAISVVNSYCNRHGVLVRSRADRASAYVLFASSLILLASVGLSYYLGFARDEARRQHRPFAEVHAIAHAMMLNCWVTSPVAVLLWSLLVLRLWKRHKK